MQLVLVTFGPIELGGSQQEATNMAEVIAMSRGAIAVPSIGISISNNQ